MQNTTSQDGEDTIRYIIVVHGIGDQRKNETVLNVVNRFAEARQAEKLDNLEILTLGRATGQTGKSTDPKDNEQVWM